MRKDCAMTKNGVFVTVATEPVKQEPIKVEVRVFDDEALKAKVMNEVRAFLENLERKYAHIQVIDTLLMDLKKQMGIG
jgi:hypothetical protein